MSSANNNSNNGGRGGKRGRGVPAALERRIALRRQQDELEASMAAIQLQLAQLADEARELTDHEDGANDNDEGGDEGGDEGEEERGADRPVSSSAGEKRPAPDREEGASKEPEKKRQRRRDRKLRDDENPWKADRE
jgi:hypothetical protein